MLNQNPRQADFVLGTCPHCEKVVRIPVTAVTSQPRSQVRCPICDSDFELAEVLEEMIPEVQIVDDFHPTAPKPATPQDSIPDRINAIDTPDLFHVSKDDYEPITEKKNGRFVVPELLSKGIEKKNRKRSRRRSRSKSSDPKLAESLAKLKENTSTTTLPTEEETESKKRGKSGRSRKSKRPGTIERIPTPSLTRIRSFSDLVEFFKACKSLLFSKIRHQSKNLRADGSTPSSKVEWVMIALGSLIAIPMLHLMMWWFVGVDPLGLARPTSHIVPFVVPNQLRAVTLDSEDSPAEPSKQTIVDSVKFQESTATRTPDGKLPKPKLDPSSVHVDNL